MAAWHEEGKSPRLFGARFWRLLWHIVKLRYRR